MYLSLVISVLRDEAVYHPVITAEWKRHWASCGSPAAAILTSSKTE